MTLEELIQKKAERLESVPDRLISRAEKAELQLFREIQLLIKELRLKDGYFVSDRANLELAGEIVEKLKEAFYGSEYATAVADFAQEFDEQIVVSDEYFKKAFPEFAASEFGVAIVEKAKRNAVKLLLQAEAEASFFLPIKDVLEEAVISGARYKDTLDVLTPYFEGKDGGKIKQYSSQIAHDTFAFADREYTSTISDEVGADWFKYSGSQIATSRPFCVERHQKYFHYKEIEGWPQGKRVDGERTPTNDGTWAGMVEGTSSQTIYTYAGGWNCRHSIVPVSIFVVPADVIKRNVQSGNFQPTEREKTELGI